MIACRDASHQLKTPLAIVKGELISCSPAPAPWRNFNRGSLSSQEIAHLIRTVENLLLLAKSMGREALFSARRA